jgi:hypothetical protein
MERIFHDVPDVSLRAMYRKPLTSRARDAAHELGTVRKCFVQALKRLARPTTPHWGRLLWPGLGRLIMVTRV